MSALLQARSLSRSFGGFTAVDDVSFDVQPGEVVGLLGANGAGKTTVIRMLLGLLRPTHGEALLNGRHPSRLGREHLGYVPQSLGLYTELTVRENLDFAAQAFGCEPMPLTGHLLEAQDRLVSDLPLGLRRQLAFVCALQHEPDVLVLDEPTSGVEPLRRARLWDQIREQSRRGVGVLVTTHYMQEAEQCDRLLLMSTGRLVAAGTVADIVDGTTAVAVASDDWSTVFEVLGRDGFALNLDGRDVRVIDPDEARLREVLAQHGIVATLRPVRATIEERMTMLGR
jgi:ABC-2 type transport system ATP-binding protein/ribosome-dependent ATPase